MCVIYIHIYTYIYELYIYMLYIYILKWLGGGYIMNSRMFGRSKQDEIVNHPSVGMILVGLMFSGLDFPPRKVLSIWLVIVNHHF